MPKTIGKREQELRKLTFRVPNGTKIGGLLTAEPGSVSLRKGGRVVWRGHLSDPWEDVDCDEVVLSRADYDDWRRTF